MNKKNNENKIKSNIGSAHIPEFIRENSHKWAELISFLRFYPDYFFDLIKDPNSKFKFDLDQRVYIRLLARMPVNYVCVTRGYSKCVTGDTILFTDEGMKEIGEYFNYDNDGIEKIQNHKINLINRNGVVTESNKGVYSGYKDTKIITTEEGYEIEGTLVHPLLVMDTNGELVWKKIKDINNGDYICVNRNNNLWGNNNSLNFDMESWLNNFSDISRNRFIKHKCNTPTELTEEFALIMGYLVGDGTLTRNDTVTLTNIDKDILDRYTSFMNEVLGVKVKKRGKCDYDTYGKYTREYLNQIGLTLKDAHNKEVPKCIMKSSKEMVSNFIKGLFDTDGTVTNCYIEHCTSSKKMSKQIQTILLNFGIVSTRKRYYNKRFKTYHYKTTIYGKNIDMYCKEIGFSCKRKQNKLEKLCGKKRNPNKDIIPFQSSNIIELYKDIKEYNPYLYRKIDRLMRKENNMTYEKLNEILLLNNVESFNGFENLKQLKDNNYLFSKVLSIKNSKNHVYDLHVPDTNSFISNGIVSHNTMVEVLNAYATACLFPGIKISMIAETKESSVSIWQSKHEEALEFFPYLKECIKSENFAKDRGKVVFVNGAQIDNMGVMQGVKGQRRHRGNAEEDNLITKKTFDDAVVSVFDIPRSLGNIKKDPEELNAQINKFTTSGFRNSDAFTNMKESYQKMKELKGGFVWTADWSVMVHFGRQSRKLVDERRDTMSLTEFKQNYTCSWIGSDNNSLISVTKLMSARKLKKLELKYDESKAKKEKVLPEYYIGIDIARKKHNRTAIVIGKVNRRNNSNRVSTIDIVNIITPPYNLNYQEQAVIIKKVFYQYGGDLDLTKSRVKAISIDINSWGQGVLEKLLEETDDPVTGESLGCFDTINTDDKPETQGSPKIIYGVIATGANNPDIIRGFVDYFEANKVKLFSDYNSIDKRFKGSEDENAEILSGQVSEFIREVSNLKIPDNTNQNNLKIVQVKKTIDKDRYSALAYLLYYIKMFVDLQDKKEKKYSLMDYFSTSWGQ